MRTLHVVRNGSLKASSGSGCVTSYQTNVGQLIASSIATAGSNGTRNDQEWKAKDHKKGKLTKFFFSIWFLIKDYF